MTTENQPGPGSASSSTRLLGLRPAARALAAIAKGELHDRIADEVSKVAGNEVECDTCGRKQSVDISRCLRNGWPKCCGSTMKLNGPSKSPNPDADGRGKGVVT